MARNLLREVEALRAALPLSTYLMLLHHGAVTGKIPVLDRFGRAVADEFSHLSGKTRVELINKLIDKVMPDKLDPMLIAHARADAIEERSLTLLSDEELARIAQGETDATNHDDGSTAFGYANAGEAGASTTEIPEFFDPPV